MPEETAVIATPPDAGGSPNVDSQAQSMEGQPSETQQNSGQAQVEGAESQASSQGNGGGPKASRFYGQRNQDRQTVRELQRQIEELKSIVTSQQRPSAPQSQTQASSQDKNKQFWDSLVIDPRGSLEQLIKEVASQEVPKIAKSVYAETSLERQWQDAEKLITSNEAYRRDGQEFLDAIKGIRDRYEIHRWVNEEPLRATQLALDIYNQERKGQQPPQPQVRPTNPNAPKKGQMVSTATGAPAMTGAPNKDALLTELRNMQKQLVDNIELRNDPKFREKLEAIKVGLMSSKK